MERFSSLAREVFEAVFYETDISKAEKLIQQIGTDTPLDIAFGKCCLMFYYCQCYDTEKSLRVLSDLDESNKSLFDPFIQVITDLMWFFYYSGGDFSVINSELAKTHFETGTEVVNWYESFNTGKVRLDSIYGIIKPDDWEIYFITGYYYILKAQYYRKFDGDLKSAIKNSIKGLDLWAEIPNDGQYLVKVYPIAENALGWWYHLDGDVKNAEKWFNKALKSTKKYENLWELWPNMNLWVINNRRGKLIESKDFNLRALEISKRYNLLFGIWINLGFLAATAFEEGNYDEALDLYQEALKYAKENRDPIVIFSAHESIFHYYYVRFKGTKEEGFLAEAKTILEILEEMSNKNPNHSQMLESIRFCKARILKQGNLRNKGKAIDLFEEILETNPEWANFYVRLELLDSLFEDVLLTNDKGTIQQIDDLIKVLATVNMINNPLLIQPYIVQQITIAKYSFYILGNLKTALDILYEAKEHLKMLHLVNLTNKVDIEIRSIENEVSKWDNIQRSVKDRIKESNITSYLQQAIEISEIQK